MRLGVVGIQLTNPHNDRSADIYTLLDSTYNTTMINEAVAKELGFTGVQMPIEIEGLNAVRSLYVQYVDITVCGIHERKSYALSKLPCVPRLPEVRASLPHTLDLIMYLDLNDLKVATISHSSCDMILGADHITLLQHLHAQDGGPSTFTGSTPPLAEPSQDRNVTRSHCSGRKNRLRLHANVTTFCRHRHRVGAR